MPKSPGVRDGEERLEKPLGVCKDAMWVPRVKSARLGDIEVCLENPWSREKLKRVVSKVPCAKKLVSSGRTDNGS